MGTWRDTFSGSQPPGHPTLRINPPEVLPAMEALGEFTSLVTGSLHPSSPFEVLPPPGTVGFLKLSRPCCYVFPAGRGDCAFFAVNGFTMLLDGGSDAQACFWKLVRHLDRVDALLVSHISTSSLAGLVSASALWKMKLLASSSTASTWWRAQGTGSTTREPL